MTEDSRLGLPDLEKLSTDPERYAELADAFQKLSAYCWLQSAIVGFLADNERAAADSAIEKRDAIYAQLPYWVKWDKEPK